MVNFVKKIYKFFFESFFIPDNFMTEKVGVPILKGRAWPPSQIWYPYF